MRTRQVKDIELRDEWKRIDEALISPELMADLPQPECTALTLLVDAMINSRVCDLGPGQGQITAKVDDEIYLMLNVEETVRNRLPKQDRQERQERVRRLFGYDEEPYHTEQTVMEIFAFKPSDTGPLDLQGRAKFPNGAKFPACVHGPKASIPALDDCASFVYWAEAGFPNPPVTISDAIQQARDPVAWSRALDMRVRNRREARRLARMRQELALVAADVARDRAGDVVSGKLVARVAVRTFPALFEIHGWCANTKMLTSRYFPRSSGFMRAR